MAKVQFQYEIEEGISPAILRIDNVQVNMPFIKKIIRRRYEN